MSEDEGDDVVVDMAETSSVTSKDEMITEMDEIRDEIITEKDEIDTEMVTFFGDESGTPTKLPYIISPRRKTFNLHQIARDGNIQEMEAMVDSASLEVAMDQLNQLDDKNQSPLHYAARYSHRDMVVKLLEMKAKVDIAGTDGMTPLHYAARYGKHNTPPGEERKTWQQLISCSEVEMSGDDPMVGVISTLLEAGAKINKPDMYKLTPLHHAAMRGNIKVINRLLQEEETININSKDVQGSTPLHIAVTYNNLAAAKMLLSIGAKVDARDKKGQTVLHRAAQEGNVRCVHLIMQNLQEEGLEHVVHEKDDDDCTALMLAVGSGDSDAVKLLLDQDQDGTIANIPNKSGEYPLHVAARTGDLETARLLIEFGGKKDQQNLLKQTPLSLTAMSESESVMAYFIELGVNVDLWDIDGFTPLMVAATEGHNVCVQQLLLAGAKLDAVNQDDQNVVHLAAKCNKAEVLETLLTHGEEIEELVNSNDCYDNTPLHLACENGQIDCVRLLLIHNADIDNKNEDEQSPIQLAAINGQVQVLKVLIEQDKNSIFDKDENDNTALHHAASNRQSEALLILLENGANVSERNSKEWTALDCAADAGALKCAKLLLEFDAPVDPMDKAHTTPLHLAAKAGHHATVHLLLEHGADVAIEDIHANNALEIAINGGCRSATKTILDSPGWKKAMRASSTGQDSRGTTVPDTPMRMLIRTFPLLAEEVFDKCHKVVTNRKNDTKTLQLDYEFIDDTFNLKEDSTTKRTKFEYCEVNEKNELVQFEEAYNGNGKVRMENHPLILMAEQKQKSLLRHPLCIALVSHKWNSYGRIIYYIQLLHYILFLILLTWYIQRTPNMKSNDNNCYYNCSFHPMKAESSSNGLMDVKDNSEQEENSLNETLVVTDSCEALNKFDLLQTVFQIGIFVLCGLGLISEIFQIFSTGVRYIRWSNLFDLFVYISSILFVTDFTQNGFRECWQWQMGSIMILMAWLNLLGDLQHFTFFGIYVIMFVEIFKTLMKFMVVFIVFIIAFGLGFSMLLLYQPAFSNSGWSILKTSVMMIGEFEYEEIFDNDGNNLPFRILTIIFFIVFLVIMSIIIVNLLVGLAVDDIQAIQDQAELTKLSLQVKFALEWERFMPTFLLRRYSGQVECLTSSKKPGWWPSGIITKKSIIIRAIEREGEQGSPGEREREQVEKNTDVKESMGQLRRDVDCLREESAIMKKLLMALAQKQDIDLNEL